MGANNSDNGHYVSSFRRYLPQILACFAKNILIITVGISCSLPTIIIPALTGLNPTNNPNEPLKISNEEAAWIASIRTLSGVIGSFASTFLDVIGRKKAIILINFPFVVSFISLHYSDSLWAIYINLAVCGFFVGCCEPPIINYIGELSEPKIRAILGITASISAEFGSGTIFILANRMPWRDAIFICTVVPIAGIICMLFVPETPHWLLSQKRTDDALKSLRWFRGWVDASDVKIEFENLQRHKARTHLCIECSKQMDENVICDHHSQEKFIERVRELFCRKNLIPLCLVLCSRSNFISADYAFSPFFVPILIFYNSPIDPNTVLVWTGFMAPIATVLAMVFIRLFGKRITHLTAMACSILTMYALGVYGFFFLNRRNDDDYSFHQQYFPLYGLLLMKFVFSLGIRFLSYLLLSEIFSYRSKTIGSGICEVTFGLASVVCYKTFYSLQEAITLPGQFILYASIGMVGFMIMYLLLPETEGRSLEDIEMYFSNKKRKLFDLYIPKSSDQQKISDH